ncbi:unnamed protein product [Urochloa decumbens]|uniref:Transcription factor n=1 Tax=Urochloa decumbens TaxID=240449 RepID=A0ABC9GZ03_9POAL
MQQHGGMDELVSPASFCPPASPPASFFSAAGLEFMSCGVPEQWLMVGDEALDNKAAMHDGAEWVSGGSHSPGSALSAGNPHAAASMSESSAARRRGRKPGAHRRFCDLRAAVPTVSRMDKASLLADAAAYIAELRGRVEKLDAEAARKGGGGGNPAVCPASGGLEEKLEVRMVGREAAAVRLTTAAARHAPARLMGALRSLDLAVQHACVSRVGGAATVQDAVVDVPAALQDEGCLRAALLHALQQDESA